MCSWWCPNITKSESFSSSQKQGKKREVGFCALDLHAELVSCWPLRLSLASVPMMPKAYKKSSFLFQRCFYFCVRWRNCGVYYGQGLEGKGFSKHSWAFREWGLHHFHHLQQGQLSPGLALEKAKWHLFSLSCVMMICKGQPMAECNEFADVIRRSLWWVVRWLVVTWSGGHGHILSEQRGIRLTQYLPWTSTQT